MWNWTRVKFCGLEFATGRRGALRGGFAVAQDAFGHDGMVSRQSLPWALGNEKQANNYLKLIDRCESLFELHRLAIYPQVPTLPR